ncbi:hypothetical protein KI688_009533 [Linnemannia hyalina]|uniref:RRM domain-containing protein n=1 Tax=Linnemannia hyalina TaxID=64524 RepID=A0A9P7Y2Q1_9FUNG|nr:hypothetical protein KI688_009533 [Linnemannia hyalina]
MSMTTLAATHDGGSGCLICQSKDQQIQAKDEVIRAKDAVIAAKDDAIAQKDQALKAERELREQLQKQLKLASAGVKAKATKDKDPYHHRVSGTRNGGAEHTEAHTLHNHRLQDNSRDAAAGWMDESKVTKKASLINIKSASSQAQEEKDALTIYIRNVTESVTYEMLHDAFSVFGIIRTLNVVHPKACAFVEFATPDAHQKALAATSVPVGDGHENVLTEKRVRKPQQTGGGFTRRPSTNNLKSFASNGNLQASFNNSSNNSSNNSNSNNNSHAHHMISTAAAVPMHTGTANSYHSMTKMNSKGTESHAKEDEGCDLTATC